MATAVRPLPTPPALMTAEEFYVYANLPENDGRLLELDEGTVIELPNPKRLHGVVSVKIGFLLETYARTTGRGQVTSNDSGVILGRDPDVVRGPDVAYFAEALSLAELVAEEGYPEVPPLLAVEVLSPDDRWSRVLRKIGHYQRAGVPLIWVVDPAGREVTAYRGGEVEPTIYAADDVMPGGDALPGLECRVADLFPPAETPPRP